MSEFYADLTHKYHEKYRTTGIALAISLTAVASAECMVFYKFYHLFSGSESFIQDAFWIVIMTTAISIFSNSFALQFYHYYGMKELSLSFFYKHKYEIDPDDINSKRAIDGSWKKARSYFKKADCCVGCLRWLVILNFLLVFLYFLVFKPTLPK